MPYRIEPPAAGGGADPLSDWTLCDLTDGTWSTNDPDTTITSLTHVAGVNKCTVSTDGNVKVTDGGMFYKAVTTEDGSAFSFSDRPVHCEFAITMPSIGWSIDTGGTTGGLNRPAVGSRVYVLAGVMTDPENLPSSPGETEWPRDIMGTGLDTSTSTHKNKRISVYNASNSATRGAITVPTQYLPTISNAEYLAGRKSHNRIHWWGRIRKHEGLTASGISLAEDPICKDMHWVYRDDVGDSKAGVLTQVTQQRFRIHNDRLYVWVCAGRWTGAGSATDLDFTVHYRIVQVDGGTCPSGRTGL